MIVTFFIVLLFFVVYFLLIVSGSVPVLPGLFPDSIKSENVPADQNVPCQNLKVLKYKFAKISISMH